MFLSCNRLKNSIFAAGSAISDSLSISSIDGYPPANQPAGFYTNDPSHHQYQQNPQYQQVQPLQKQQRSYEYQPSDVSVSQEAYLQQPPARFQEFRGDDRTSTSSSGLFNRLRSLFTSEGPDATNTISSTQYRPMYPHNPAMPTAGVESKGEVRLGSEGIPALPPHLLSQYQQQNHHQQQLPQPNNQYHQYSTLPDLDSQNYVNLAPPPSSASSSFSISSSSPPQHEREGGRDGYPDIPLPLQQQQMQQQMRRSNLAEAPSLSMKEGASIPSASGISAGITDTQNVGQPQQQEFPMAAEPQVFVHSDNIVMILRPREFYRKKQAIIAGGAKNLQVFTDFERVMTRFRTSSGQRAM